MFYSLDLIRYELSLGYILAYVDKLIHDEFNGELL